MLTEAVIANKAYAKLSVPGDCTIDTIALNVIKQDCPDFLLPIKTMEINGEMEVRYEMTDGVRMSYSASNMLKRDFTALLINMLTPFKTCGDWFLNKNNIYLDRDYIMLGKDGTSIRYVYIPVPEYAQTEAQIVDFFFNVILSKKIIDDEAYTVELMRILKSGSPNSLMELLDALVSKSSQQSTQASFGDAEMPRNVPNPVDTERVLQPQSKVREAREPAGHGALFGRSFGEKHTPEPQADAKKMPAPEESNTPVTNDSDVKNQLMDRLYGGGAPEETSSEKGGDKPKKGLFDSFRGKKKDRASEEEKPKSGRATCEEKRDLFGIRATNGSSAVAYSPVYAGSDSTDIDDNVTRDNSVLQLRLAEKVRYNCPQFIEIPLETGSATVGRYDKAGQPCADFNFDASLSFVSRQHFRVEKNADQWVIIDLESRNGTFLNGAKLVPNMKYSLSYGDAIMLSKEHRLTYTVC